MSNIIDIEIDEDVFLPCYRHLQSDTSDIRFLWGGRDSGKSQDIAMRKIKDCLEKPYFRDILIKKTGNSIKDSQWQTIKDVCTDWGIDHLFSFTTHPLEITCTVNGNKFIARGCDDVGKLKSIRNPTGAWVEEGNQLSEDDLVVLLTTLRNDNGNVQIDMSLNPEAEDVEFEEFYLYKQFFKKWCEQGIYTFTDKFEMKLPSGQFASLTYSATHTTYHDNPYVTPQRVAFHESLQKNNPYYYNVFTLGMWGVRPAGNNPFATAYDPAIHESEEVQRNHHKQLFISIDFNLNPFAVTFSHIWQDQLGMHLHTFDEAEIGIGSIPAMIELIKGKYADQLHNCLMTGDSGGNKGDLSQSDQASWFEQLRRGLNLRRKQVIVPGNPFHETSRSDCNYLLHHSGIPASKIDVKINPTNCPGLCRDLKNVQCDAFGGIIKRNRKDVNQRGDFVDTWRYKCNTFLKKFILQHQKMNH